MMISLKAEPLMQMKSNEWLGKILLFLPNAHSTSRTIFTGSHKKWAEGYYKSARFFGRSVIEAIYSDCIPLLPNRLSLAEHIPDKYKKQFLYENADDFYQKLKSIILNFKELKTTVPLHNFVQHYDWSTFAPLYDKRFSQLINKPQNHLPPS